MDQDPTNAAPASDDDALTSTQLEERQRLEYDEADRSDAGSSVAQDDSPQTIASVPLGNIGRPAEGKVWHARLPNFLSLDPRPFEQEVWVPPTAEGEMQEGEDEVARSKAELPDENVVRWRWAKDEAGQDVSSLHARAARLPIPCLVD